MGKPAGDFSQRDRTARRCRELMLAAWSADLREQLRLWAEEFDQQAEPLERQLARRVSEPRQRQAGDIGRQPRLKKLVCVRSLGISAALR